MFDLHLTLIQSDISWENPMKNIEHFGRKIVEIPTPTDLVVLPEMFNTEFSINPQKCSETMYGPAIGLLREKSAGQNCMIMGSILTEEKGSYFNRLTCMRPDGTFDQYGKRHLFRLSDEYKVMAKGKKKGIVIYVANWPKSRAYIWKSLLIARAIENECYVIGVNRIGKDGHGRAHSGDSMVIGPEGDILASAETDQPAFVTTTLSMKKLYDFREKYPFAQDWDHFTILL